MLRLDTRQAIAGQLDLIRDLFKPGAKLTLLIRNPTIDDADILFTSDTLPEVVASIRHRELTDKKQEPVRAWEDTELRDATAETLTQIATEGLEGLELDAALDAILTSVDERYERKLA